mgnify:CR=1 FL=1
MSRQFRSDDTNKWLDGFGNGKDGNLNYTGGNFGGVNGYGIATFTGTSGNYSGTFTNVAYFNGSNGGRVGDIVLIHQSKGTGAGNWELNKITGRSGSTLYLKYPLQNNYTTGAQIISSGQWVNASFSGTTTPYLGWNGSAGGIFFLIGKSLTLSGTINYKGGDGASQIIADNTGGGSGGGYRGGNIGAAEPTPGGFQGEGYNGGLARSYSNAGNGAGGGWQGAPGGGHGTAGNYGLTWNGYNDTTSTPGQTASNAQLTNMVFGGGGGGGNGEGHSGSKPGAGGAGGGIVVLIFKTINITGSINVNGGNGGNAYTSDWNGNPTSAGGGGAGGAVLLKCQTATIGSNLITALGGARGTVNQAQRHGGAGGVGRIHLDYKISYSGSTNPTLDARQDLTLNDITRGSFLLNFI